MDKLNSLCHQIIQNANVSQNADMLYPNSLHRYENSIFFMAHMPDARYLIVIGDSTAGFEGTSFTVDGMQVKKCALTPQNAAALMALFPFTKPRSHKGFPFTFGLGDRLGIASPGHIATIRGKKIFPILAQQSMREVKLTGRSYERILADAAFAVFQEDWQDGYGADGDHLKTEEEIRYALDCGYTMITLDCSEHIDNDIQDLCKTALDAKYADLPAALRNDYEQKYAGKTFTTGDSTIAIGDTDLKSIVLTYHDAIEYTQKIYQDVILPCGRDIDFEMSIDETLCPTAPEAHYVVAAELIERGVRPVSLAPRFCGEFQKGIDYIGNLDDFEREFIEHEQIARHFGYKLSIHSGSDKFAVFGIIGKYTGLNVHVKTAGTNWLEAIHVISLVAPALYRKIHAFALEHFDEARAYYHVGADPSKITPLEAVPDEALPDYFNHVDSRQVLHITYGLVLNAKASDGSYLYRDDIYSTLHQNEKAYRSALQKHIGRHIETLAGGAK